MRRILAFNYSQGWVQKHPDAFTALVRDSLRYKRPPRGIMAQALGIASFDVADALPSLCIPVLVVHGDEDAIIPIECGRSIAAKVPGRCACAGTGLCSVICQYTSMLPRVRTATAVCECLLRVWPPYLRHGCIVSVCVCVQQADGAARRGPRVLERVRLPRRDTHLPRCARLPVGQHERTCRPETEAVTAGDATRM